MRRLNARQCQAAVKELLEIGEEVDRQLGLTTSGPVTLDLDSFDSEVCTGASRERRSTTWASAATTSSWRPGPSGDGSWPRTPTLHQLLGIHRRAWRPALQMPQAEIAETTYAPKDWRHEPLRLSVRRVRVPVEDLGGDPRSRRRRTVPKAQLELALAGRVEYVYAYSFILAELDGDAAEIEHWHRQCAQIEERVQELKLGDGLLHFPLGTLDANRAWRTAGVIPHNLVSVLSAVVADVNHRRLRNRLAQHSGRRVILRLAQDMHWAATFVAAYQRLRLLTAGDGGHDHGAVMVPTRPHTAG